MHKKIKTVAKSIILVLISLKLISCASVRYASPKADAQAKQFIASKHKGVIYVYRGESLETGYFVFGFGQQRGFQSDRIFKRVARLYAGSYIRCDLDPGLYEMAAMNEREDMQLQHLRGFYKGTVPVKVKAGEIYLFSVDKFARISPVSDNEDRQAILRGRLVRCSLMQNNMLQAR